MKSLLLSALLSLLALGSALAQVRVVPAFHAIQVSGGIKLIVREGAPQHVEVSVLPAELASYLKTTVEAGVLTLRFEPLQGHVRTERLLVTVTARQLTALTASSGAAVDASGAVAAPTFALDASAGAAVRAELNVRELTVRQDGGSVINLGGQANRLTLTADGGSIFKGGRLQAATCRADADGGSVVQLYAKDELTASADGGSTIKYQGSPKVTKKVDGSSIIKGA